jgi:hypothetical protein
MIWARAREATGLALACQKAKELGYPHELWTTRLLAHHAREHGPAQGHECLANLAQGTVCKILDQEEVKPHKVRYYLEQRDLDFAEKMAEVLCVYRHVKILKQAATGSKRKRPSDPVAIISYDEKPGIQATATTAPDLPPEPGVHATFAREHEYKRHGTVSLLAGIDLVTGKVHALVSWLNLVEGFFSKFARSGLRHIRVASKQELKDRLIAAVDYFNRDPVVHTWTYRLDKAA